MLPAVTWCLTAVLMLVGVVGVVVPVLPGTTLILIAAIVHKLILPGVVSWTVIGVVAIFWVLSLIADFGGVIIGTRMFGGSKWGMAGASGGALIGIFFSFWAFLLGTVLGAIVAEKLMTKKTDRQVLKAGLGAFTGFLLSTVARLACAAAMIGVFLFFALTGTHA